MRPEDVPEHLVLAAAKGMCDGDLGAGMWDRCNSAEHNAWLWRARHALATVLPLAVAEEREACAKEADYYDWHSVTARNIARAIRSRGEPQ